VIEARDVAVFIDAMMVETETEERYNKYCRRNIKKNNRK